MRGLASFFFFFLNKRWFSSNSYWFCSRSFDKRNARLTTSYRHSATSSRAKLFRFGLINHPRPRSRARAHRVDVESDETRYELRKKYELDENKFPLLTQPRRTAVHASPETYEECCISKFFLLRNFADAKRRPRSPQPTATRARRRSAVAP